MHERDCIESPAYQTDKNKKYRGWFYGYNSMHAEKFKCVSVQGTSHIQDSEDRSQSVSFSRSRDMIF